MTMRGHDVLPWRWPTWTWLTLLGVIFLIRFSVLFALHPPFLMDYDVFRAVAQRVLQGDALHLYDPTTSTVMLFKYAPCWALILAPLAWLTPHAGAILWSLTITIWLLLTLWLSDRLCARLDLRPPGWLALVTILLLVRSLTSEYLLGQTNVLWGVLIVAFIVLDVTQRPWLAACCLALAISLKVPALLFLAYFALARRWAALGRTLLCLIVMNLASAWLLVPHDPTRLFVAWLQVLRTSGPSRAFEIGSQSLVALMGRLLRRDGYGLNLLSLSDASVIRVAGALELLIFLWLFFPRKRDPAHGSATQGFIVESALLMVCMVLFSPTAWIATYNALLFPAFLALALFLRDPAKTFRSIHAVAQLTVISLLSVMTHAKFWHLAGVWYFKGESYVFLVLMIFPLLGLALLWTLAARRRIVSLGGISGS